MIRFQVALSYASEQRELVSAIAEELAAKLGREKIFYDGYHQAELYRANLDQYLQEIYHKNSELIVVFLSDDYGRKEWTQVEWRAVRDLIKQGIEWIMLVRVDDASVPGTFSLDVPLDARQFSAEQIAKAILERLRHEQERSVARSAEPHQLAAAVLATALAAYRSRVAQDFYYVDVRDILDIEEASPPRYTAALPRDQVYVPSRLLPARAHTEEREREQQLVKELDNLDLEPQRQQQLLEDFARLTGERWRADPKKSGRGLPAAEALSSARHAVVIGAPGVGKSSLTRYLARSCALDERTLNERLGWTEAMLTPVVLPLAAFAGPARGGVTLRQFLDAHLLKMGNEALRQAVAVELATGRVYLMLDGLDEIPESENRRTVVRAIDRFISNYAANRILVTSRPYGYIPLAGDIPHFQVLNFSDEEVTTFLRQWHHAVELWRNPNTPNLERVEREVRAIRVEIWRSRNLAQLATNPLMLVILSLIHHDKAHLPEERVELYDQAVNKLMRTWNRGLALEGIDAGGSKLTEDQLIRVWGVVAEWTRRTQPTGIVRRAKLERKLVEILAAPGLDERHPEATAKSYLNAAADRVGLLEERGRNIFAFWHTTFEEFLAAIELATPSTRAISRILPLRDNPRWREVILLAVGYLGVVQEDPDTAAELVEAIWLQDPGPLEPILHSHLHLAAACMAEYIGIERSLADRVIAALAEAARELPYEPMSRTFAETVRALPHFQPSPATVSVLRSLAMSTKAEDQARGGSVRLLANAAATNPEALATCRLLAKRGQYPDIAEYAALGCLRGGLFDAEYWWIVGAPPQVAAKYLSAIPHPALQALAGCLKHATNPSFLPGLLSQLGGEPSRLRQALEPLLLEADDPKIRLAVALRLRDLQSDHARLRAALEPLLGAEDPEIRLEAAAQLHKLGAEADRLQPVLVGLLASGKGARFNLRVLQLLQVVAPEVVPEEGTEQERIEEARLLGDLLETARELLEKGSRRALIEGTRALRELGIPPERLGVALSDLPDWKHPIWGSLSAARRLRSLGADPSRLLAALEPLPEGAALLSLGALPFLLWIGDDPARLHQSFEALLAGPSEELRLRAVGCLLSQPLPSIDTSRLRQSLEEILLAEEGGDASVRAELKGDGIATPVPQPASKRLQAARLLSKIGVDPDCVRQTIHPWLIGSEFDLGAAELLSELGAAEEFPFERLANMVHPHPIAALDACQKVAAGQPLDAADGKTLFELLRAQQDDDRLGIGVKWRLFSWLQRTLARHAEAASL